MGKTALALDLANHYGAEIISVDSVQVYRHLDIGTAKASPEERRWIPHHLIDIVEPDDNYSLARFITAAAIALKDIQQRGRTALFTGGSGLYLRGLSAGIFELTDADPQLRGQLRRRLQQRLQNEGHDALHAELTRIDPESARRIHPHDLQRLLRALEIFYLSGTSWSEHLRRSRQTALLTTETPIIGLVVERDILYERINHRVENMLAQGLVDEVRGLLEQGYDPELSSMQSIGYRHMVAYLSGRYSLKEAKDLMARDTRRYAKRQLTWFRRMKHIHWYLPEETNKIKLLLEATLKN